MSLGRTQGGSPSVHLTISSFQRQSLYDLVQKTFEEVILKLFRWFFDGFWMFFGCFWMFFDVFGGFLVGFGDLMAWRRP